MKPCQRCGDSPALPKQRFCNTCRLLVLKELKQAGYLRPAPTFRNNYHRGRDSMQEFGDHEGSESRFDK